MNKKKKYIWYACYGSNLLRKRFYAYIEGKYVKELSLKEEGCNDKTLPVDESTLEICNRLYFSGNFSKWENMGCAFIDIEEYSDLRTLCKLYLITEEQFCGVVKQENRLSITENISIPQYINNGGVVLFPNNSYGRIMRLGTKNNWPIYTFTSPKGYSENIKTIPSDSYLNVLVEGLMDTFDVDESFAKNYFRDRMK